MDVLDAIGLETTLDRLPRGISAITIVRSRRNRQPAAPGLERDAVVLPVDIPWIDAELAAHIPPVRSLRIDGVQIRAAALEPLASALDEVETLELVSCELNDDRLTELGPLLRSTALRHLNLSGNQIGAAGLTAMITGRPQLAHLDLSSTGMWEHELDLLNKEQLPTLQVLRLAKNSLSGRRAAFTLEAFPELRELDLRDNRIGRRRAKVLQLAAKPKMELLLEHNRGTWTWRRRSLGFATGAIGLAVAAPMAGLPWFTGALAWLGLTPVVRWVDQRVRNREAELADEGRRMLMTNDPSQGGHQ